MGGDFIVQDSGTVVYPDADKVTGVPVFFKVGGDFTLGAGAIFDARRCGWGWNSGSTAPTGAKTNPGGQPKESWTFAPGSGHAYHIGGGYGGNAASVDTTGGRKYGYAYGSSIAPFLPGSCSGRYTQSSDATVDNVRGGGAVVVFATGSATVNGVIDASSSQYDHSGASGGAIWLLADSFTFGSGHKLDAHGSGTVGYSGQGCGGGGRIALAEGLSFADMALLAGGAIPTGFIDYGVIPANIATTDVAGGIFTGTGKNYNSNPGTLAYIRDASLPVPVTVMIDGPGSVSYGGTTYSSTFIVDVPPRQPLAFSALPDSACSFVSWFGDKFPSGADTNLLLSLVTEVPFTLRAGFCSSSAMSRTWNGGSSQDWYSSANWSPSGIPGPNDSVTIASGAPSAPYGISIGSLNLRGGSLSVGGSTERNDCTLTATGDVAVSGGAKLTVYAGTLADYSPFATVETDISGITNALWQAAKIVSIGGDFSVTGNGSTVVPDADPVTGVPVVFKVGGDLLLGEGAQFDGDLCGFGWNTGTAPAGGKPNGGGGPSGWTFSPGAGMGYYYGGGYGGASSYPYASAGVKYGYAYGSAIAPFLPGSCSGWYNQTGLNVRNTRGGGSVVIFAAGSATLNGTVDVSSSYHDYAGASGGGIWIGAHDFVFGANALLDAHGSGTERYDAHGLGGGGRIALAEGLDWNGFNQVAGGAIPARFRDFGTILPSEIATDVAGGIYTGTDAKYTSNPGTLAFVRSSALPVEVNVSIIGNGTVTYNGTSYNSTFTVMVPTYTDLTFVAVPGPGTRFISWGGSIIPGGASLLPELVFSTEAAGNISVTFLSGNVTRVWQGGAAGDWSGPLNWSPFGCPAGDESVIISNSAVTLSGPAVVSNLVLAGSAELTVKASPITGPSDAATLYAGATVFRANGAISVDDTARLVPENDQVTGSAVRFECASFHLAENAVVDASQKGWKWYSGTDDDYAVLFQGTYQTRAIGAGGDDVASGAYNRGAGYGANGGNANAKYGKSYGYAYAPFLPGSPNGLYQFQIDKMGLPGGTVWIRSSGLMELDGQILSNGALTYFGSPSGGGVWLAAPGLRVGSQAGISARGGELGGSYTSYGAGGRVSIALGLTTAQLDSLAAGEMPVGLEYTDSVDAIPVDVRGARRNTSSGYLYGNSGTATTVTGPLAYQRVSVASDGVLAHGVEPDYGAHAFEGGSSVTFTAPQYGIDPVNPDIRYQCLGCDVVNALGETNHYSGTSVAITIENAPITLTWSWGSSNKRVMVRKPANGSLAIDDVAVDGDAVAWTTGATPSISVVPDEGYEFVCWEGSIPLGLARSNPVSVTIAEPLDIIPVLRPVSVATTRTWNGTGLWTASSNWNPAGIPGALDSIVIASGTCIVSNSISAASLSVSQGATLDVGTSGDVNGDIVVSGNAEVNGAVVLGYGLTLNGNGDPASTRQMTGHTRFAVGGSLLLAGTARMDVFGGPVGGGFDFAGGCSFIDVGGMLSLAGSSVIALTADAYSGGPVRISARKVTVASEAKIDAAGKGYAWLGASLPPNAPGIGYSFEVGASHGGIGGASQGLVVTPPYDSAIAPVMPGSPNGNYASGFRPGGGAIRIHASEIEIYGTLDASAYQNTTYGGASGGSIWLTANNFAFGESAKLLARGGKTSHNYLSSGAGGRISICRKLTESAIATLAAGGPWAGYRSCKSYDMAAFREMAGNATMQIDVEMGSLNGTVTDSEATKYADQKLTGDGSFVFYSTERPTILLLK